MTDPRPDPTTSADAPQIPDPALAPTVAPTIVRHPVRGGLWGLLLGLGIALYTLLFGVFELFSWTGPVAVAVAGIVVGVLWGLFAPARRPKAT